MAERIEPYSVDPHTTILRGPEVDGIIYGPNTPKHRNDAAVLVRMLNAAYRAAQQARDAEINGLAAKLHSFECEFALIDGKRECQLTDDSPEGTVELAYADTFLEALEAAANQSGGGDGA